VEYNGKRFLKIRNPWGQGEWNGRWSDGSKEWTKEWLPALELLDHSFGDDGSFIMQYEDFLETWYAVERTQLFDASWIQSSHWLNVTSRTYPCAWQFGDISCMHQLLCSASVQCASNSPLAHSHVQSPNSFTSHHCPVPSRPAILERAVGLLFVVVRFRSIRERLSKSAWTVRIFCPMAAECRT
jgi:Calpain family cysteine protease